MKSGIYIIGVILVLSFSVEGISQQVLIKGNAKSYAGEVLELKTYEDQISLKEKLIEKCTVATNGDFQFKFNLSETVLSFIHLNVFKGILYIEPGKQYEIVLPQKLDKLPEDELNPFFEEKEFSFRIINAKETDLNELIRKFDAQYDFYLNKHFYLFKGKLNKSVVDSIINAIEISFPKYENPFFNDYKKYRYTTLQMVAYERNKEKIIESLFCKKPILYQNPAYMDLFNRLFSNYLASYSQTQKGEKIPYFLIKEKSLKKIKQAMSDTTVLNDDNLQDLIICKSLFENFYKEDYPKESIIFMIDSLRIAAKSKENKTVANNIYEKITTLLTGYPVPDFELPDKEGKLHSLSKSRGKFVYLNFINPQSYTCQQELDVLKKMKDRNYEMLEIITICICNSLEEFKKIGKAYNWTFLYYAKDPELLKKFEVKVYPTYYLINPESKLLMAPAFPPTEPTFEARYFDMVKAWKKEIESKKNKKGLQN